MSENKAVVGRLWTVCWTDTRGNRRMVDFDTREEAGALAILVAEVGRRDVAVSGPIDVEIDEERVTALKERIMARIRGMAAQRAQREGEDSWTMPQ